MIFWTRVSLSLNNQTRLGENIHDLALFLNENKEVAGRALLGNNLGDRDKDLGLEKNSNYFWNPMAKAMKMNIIRELLLMEHLPPKGLKLSTDTTFADRKML